MTNALITAVQKVYGGVNTWGGFVTIEGSGAGGWEEAILDTGVVFDASLLQCQAFDFVRAQHPMLPEASDAGLVDIKALIAVAPGGHAWYFATDAIHGTKVPVLFVMTAFEDDSPHVFFVEFGREWSGSK